MALTNFKSNVKHDSFDDGQRLMCSVPGCSSRWSVHLDGDKPKCTTHQWQEKTYSHPSIEKSVTQTVQQWYESESF
jgi:hypothetical protein